MIDAAETVPVMDGRQVFKLAVTLHAARPRASCSPRHGYGLDDLDLLVMHQANLRINEAAQKALGLPDAKVHNNIQKYGNTTSATLPLCLPRGARGRQGAARARWSPSPRSAPGLHWGAVLLRV